SDSGTCVDTKFAKPSILGKPVLQPHRNQSVVKQLTAFKSERCKFSKPRFASQVDVINDLSKPVTPHYVPVAKKKTQDKNTSLKPSVRHTTSLQNTTNGSKPKPKKNNQTSRSLPVPKSSCGMSNGVPLVAHSRNLSSFSDSKHFICSTCQKCVFNSNHDDCITKFLKKVNSRAKIVIGQRFSLNKSFAVLEKPNTPRSCLRWIPTGRIFKTAGLRWIPTGNMFTDSTTKVDSKPPNGSNEDITNPYECKQSLYVSACTLNLSAVQASDLNVNKMASADNTSGLALQIKERSGSLSSTTIDQDVPSASSSPTTQEIQSQVTHQGEFTLSSLDVLQGFIFFLQIGLTLILATFDSLDVGLLGDVFGEDDSDDDD
nr:hypothetical protein [Tanacetum cinerariifolium]